MSWVTFALGLIRDVATTEAGQDMIRDLRSSGAERPRQAPANDADLAEWRQSVENRIGVLERNVETLVQMLNAHDEGLALWRKRQRAWNLSLAGGLIVALAAIGWMLLA